MSLLYFGWDFTFVSQIHFMTWLMYLGYWNRCVIKRGRYFCWFLLRLWWFRLAFATDLWSLCHSGDSRVNCFHHGNWFWPQSAWDESFLSCLSYNSNLLQILCIFLRKHTCIADFLSLRTLAEGVAKELYASLHEGETVSLNTSVCLQKMHECTSWGKSS